MFTSYGEVEIARGGAVLPDVAAEQATGHGEAGRLLPRFRRCHLRRRPQISTGNRSESLRINTKPASIRYVPSARGAVVALRLFPLSLVVVWACIKMQSCRAYLYFDSGTASWTLRPFFLLSLCFEHVLLVEAGRATVGSEMPQVADS